MTEGHVTCTARNRPFDKGNLIQTGKLISIHFFVGYVKICSSPETFYSWIFEPPKKGNFGLTLSKKNKQTNKLKYMLSQCLVLQETHSKGAALKAGIRNLKSEIQNPESGSSGSFKIQQLGCTKIVSRKP